MAYLSGYPNTLNILIVTPTFPPKVTIAGGAAVRYGALTNTLAKMGHTVHVISPSMGNVDTGTAKVVYSHINVITPTLHNMRFINESIKQADVIVCPENLMLPILVFLAHCNGKPIITNMHTNVRYLMEMTGAAGRYIFGPLFDLAIRPWANLSTRSFTTSLSYRDELQRRGYRIDGVFSPRFAVSVFQQVNYKEDEVKEARSWLSAGRPQLPLCIYAGRFSFEKQILLLTKGIPQGTVLALVGDGPGQEGDTIAALHNPTRNIIVHRGMVSRERLRILYKASDFVVSASSSETFGLTVTEANCCGIPAIAQAAIGFNNQIVQGENGFLIDFNSPDARNKILEAFKNKPSGSQVLAIAKENIENAELIDLEKEIILTAQCGSQKEQWSSGFVSLLILIPAFVFFFLCYKLILIYPLTRSTSPAKKAGVEVFDKDRLAQEC